MIFRAHFLGRFPGILVTVWTIGLLTVLISPAMASDAHALAASSVRYEAEHALLENVMTLSPTHTTINAPVATFGSSLVDDDDSPNALLSSVTFEVSVPEDSLYDLTFYVFSTFRAAGYVYIDDQERVSLKIPLERDFQPVRILADLKSGDHRIRLEGVEGFFFVDALTVTLRQQIVIEPVTAPPVNPNASDEAIALKAYLNECYGNVILSGQHADGIASPEINAIHTETGKHPAIIEFDFLYTGKTAQENLTVNYHTTQNAIDWWKKGGISAFCWHWLAPKDNLLDSALWNKTFEARSTAFDLGRALSGEDAEGYALLLADIDAVSQELKVLRDAGVPVLWRPMHETVSGFFWWGAAGPEASIELWRLMYDRMVNHHGLNNLLWIWSGSSDGCDILDWYPGDDVVDIVGLDIYDESNDPTHQADRFLAAQSSISPDKIITLSETGTIPQVDQLAHLGNLWAWFSPWNREFVVDMRAGYEKGLYSEAYTDLATLCDTYDHPLVVTLDELPSLYTPPPQLWKYVAAYTGVFLLFFGRPIVRFLLRRKSKHTAP